MSYQTKPLEKGDLYAVVSTSMGDITVKLFKNEAPKTVDNFVTHAKNEYYNGIIFHRVIKDFMIQGGDPTGTGRGGESIYGAPFEDEFNPTLHNIRGALSMANAGPCTNGSQFFIVEASSCPEGMLEQMKELENAYPKDCQEDYKALGGTPWLDYKHTVFGQVMEGMDTVERIANTHVGMMDKPLHDIEILNITVAEF